MQSGILLMRILAWVIWNGCILSAVRYGLQIWIEGIVLDNRSRDSYLLQWQDMVAEEESAVGELEGEAEEELWKYQ